MLVDIFKKVLIYGGGIAGTLVVGNFVMNKIRLFRDSRIKDIKKVITDIKDPDVQIIVKALCRLAAKNLPDASGLDKFHSVTKEIQKIVPDWVISDGDIEKLVQETYEKFKDEFKAIS